VPGRAVGVERRVRRRRQHHDQAEQVEDGHEGEHPGEGVHAAFGAVGGVEQATLPPPGAPAGSASGEGEAGPRPPTVCGTSGGGHRGAPPPTRWRTWAAKTSPRSEYERNQSNDVHPGERSTTSPGRARRAASATTSAMSVCTVETSQCPARAA